MADDYHSSFITNYDGSSQELRNNVLISGPILDEITPTYELFSAIWDTGATHSVISKRVVDKLNLFSTGISSNSFTASGQAQCESFLISIILPNKLHLESVKVLEMNIATCDVLIGMDIIGKGDFAVSSFNGKTSFTFRTPSINKIDFVQEAKDSRAIKPARKKTDKQIAARKKKKANKKRSRNKK